MVNLDKISVLLRVMDIAFCIIMLALSIYYLGVSKDSTLALVYLAMFFLNAYLVHINLSQRFFFKIVTKKTFRETL